MHARTAPGSTNGGDVKLPAPGDLVFIYDGGPGLVTRLEGWALGMVELLFGDGVEATRRRMVGVYRNPAGELDIAAFVTPLAVAEAAWHLVSPAGDIVNGGPRGNGTRPSQSQAELEAVRDSGRYPSRIGATAVFGIPGTSQRAPSVDTEADDTQAPVDGGFTAARGGQYRWYDPEPAAAEESVQKSAQTSLRLIEGHAPRTAPIEMAVQIALGRECMGAPLPHAPGGGVRRNVQSGDGQVGVISGSRQRGGAPDRVKVTGSNGYVVVHVHAVSNM
ncbi:hypothetical protein [Streptomyces niveus]|uniref:hypothetical protein n=1 Tax=Streptomyces niveus TaxID=193462 RepID=UPI00084C3F52|nr:hypothetical protein [Streptomyces niveus]